MAKILLRLGMKDNNVIALQKKLNIRLRGIQKLETDGKFGENTRRAVLHFQRSEWLVEDGEVGPCTWNAVMGTEAYLPILYQIPFIPQPTPTTCWAASTAMVTRSSVYAVIARTPPDLILPAGDLRNFSETRYSTFYGMLTIMLQEQEVRDIC
jgi:peptidoglycan hydrolase-like protein with peptidoglycan-binding domain